MRNRNTIHRPNVKFEYNKRIINKSTDAKIYRDAVLLTPGTWHDSLSNTAVKYPKKTLEKSYKQWNNNYLNLDHSQAVLDRIGYVKNTKFEDNAIKGDIYIFPFTKNSKDVIQLIENDMINWLSVEIKTEDVWKDDHWVVNDIVFLGTAVVTTPACEDAKIKEDGPDVIYDD